MDRRTDQQAYFPTEMQFYLSMMFLGFPNEIHEEKPSFLDFENNWLRTDGRTDGPTDGPTDRPSYRDARTHLKSIRNSFKTVNRGVHQLSRDLSAEIRLYRVFVVVLF